MAIGEGIEEGGIGGEGGGEEAGEPGGFEGGIGFTFTGHGDGIRGQKFAFFFRPKSRPELSVARGEWKSIR